jgi:hypothetical protein
MLIGALLMFAGCLLLIKNRELAGVFDVETRGVFSEFARSAARQNIAVVGVTFFAVGFGMFLFL